MGPEIGGAEPVTMVPSMEAISRDRLDDALVRLNILRAGEAGNPVALELLEGAMEALFSVSRHLIVYGSLAPGGLNHGLLSGLEGEWKRGWVTGELLEIGWGAAMSYPALRWCPEGKDIDAFLFISPHLPEHWPRLDDFEGLEYRRILVPFWTAEGRVWVGNAYAMECDQEP
jgi:gamma-glutamylcyclotransferase (GGCT)/AIG2-like uncharacterized protein YtfP